MNCWEEKLVPCVQKILSMSSDQGREMKGQSGVSGVRGTPPPMCKFDFGGRKALYFHPTFS